MRFAQAVLWLQATLRPENSQMMMATVINPTRPASPSDLTSAMTLSVTLPKGGPMTANAIYDTVCKRTRKAFGFSVNPHRFRHVAGTLWSIEDPKNVRGVKDLFGHASYDKMTGPHYIMGQSRIAGRALAKAIDAATK